MAEVLIDDFEDNDIVVSGTGWSGWNGTTAEFLAQSDTVLAGSFSGELVGQDENLEVTTTRSSGFTGVLQCRLRIDAVKTGASNGVAVQATAGTNGLIGEVEFQDDSGDIVFNGSSTTTLTTWATATTYRVAIRYDGTDCHAYIDGTEYGPFTPANAEPEILEFELRNDTTGTTGPRSAVVDELYENPHVDTPALSIASQSDATTDFSYTNVSFEDSYELYRDGTSGVTTADTLVASPAADTTSVSDTSPDRDQQWYYAIRAVGSAEWETSDLSAEVVTQEFGDPTLSVDATRDDEIDLSVTYPPNAEEIDVYRAEATGVGTGDTLATTLTGATTHTDASLENGERYYYVVQARDTDGVFTASELSAEDDGTTALPTPTIDSVDDVAETNGTAAGVDEAIGDGESKTESEPYQLAGTLTVAGSGQLILEP